MNIKIQNKDKNYNNNNNTSSRINHNNRGIYNNNILYLILVKITNLNKIDLVYDI